MKKQKNSKETSYNVRVSKKSMKKIKEYAVKRDLKIYEVVEVILNDFFSIEG